MLGVREEGTLGVGVGVDEAGRDGEAGRVDHPPGVGAGEVVDGGDGLALHADVGPAARTAGAVHDRATADHQVEHEGLLPPTYRTVRSRSRAVSRSTPVSVTRTGSPSAT